MKLNEKYAGELLIDDKYMNLTAKNKDVTADIESRGKVLLIQQQREIEVIDSPGVHALHCLDMGMHVKTERIVY